MNLFNLVKKKKYKELIKYLQNNQNINLNIQDEFENYLIEYILDTNDIKLIGYFLSKNIYLDIIDNNGTTILYNLIKFNKIEILKLVINNNASKIGINILDRKDTKGRSSLHYCVLFKNVKAITYILENGGDPFIKDKIGDNIFFYCIKYDRTEILFILFTLFNKYTMINKDGENLLQSSILYSNKKSIDYLINNTNINLDNQTIEYGLTALHQLTINNDIKNIKKIINKGANVDISDFLGNNLIHFSIIDKNNELILYFLKLDKIDLNLPNLNGNTPLHLYLIDNNSFNKEILDILISKTNLNIQNNDGNSVIHLLSKRMLIEKYKYILKYKILNIFIQNYKGNTVLNIFKNKEFLIKLASESFFNNLIETNLILDWEKECAKIKLGNDDSKKNKCIKQIENVIKKENRSLPKTKKIKFDLDSGVILKECFFSGFPIDTLFGILWLKNKYKNISLILDFPLRTSDLVENFYKKMGANMEFQLDFINSMILWSYQKIYYPDYFDTVLKRVLLTNPSVIIIPIGIETPQGAHTNILFWNIKKNILERFEPNGKNPPISFNYNAKLLDTIIIEKFKIFSKDLKYITPRDYLPTIGFQMIENLETETCKQIGDPNGFCTVWSIWYCYQKLLNLDTPSKDLIEQLINNIKLEGKSFKNLIRNFSKNISEYRDKYLSKVDLDINAWVLSNYSEKQLQDLEKIIIELI